MDQKFLKELRPLLVGNNWELFSGYLSARRDQLVTRLISCNTEELKEIQGHIKMLDELLRLPNLITE